MFKNAQTSIWSVLTIPKIRLSIFIAGMAILAAFNSCKKEIRNPKSAIPTSSVNVNSVSYGEFLRNINVNALGVLKQKLNTAPKGKLLSIADNNDLGALAIYTDSVKRIIDDGDTSYIFRMALSSPHAITFRNLSIHIAGGKTSAFIATYTPTKDWIASYKAKHYGKFEGTVSFAPINLSGLSLLQALSSDGSSGANGKTMSVGAKSVTDVTTCTDYDTYYLDFYGCSDGGHYPWDEDCPWNEGWIPPEGEHAAGWIWVKTVVTECETVTIPDPPSGGGGTTPIPPEPYDPCLDGPQMISAANNVGGLKLAIVPPTTCDGGGLYPLPPSPPPLPEVQDIRMDSLMKYYPCMALVILNKLAEDQGYEQLKAPFTNPNNSLHLPRLTYGIRTDAWKPDTINTALTTTNGFNWDALIEFNKPAIENASELFLAGSAIHEIGHAYVNYYLRMGKAGYAPNNTSWSLAIANYGEFANKRNGVMNVVDHSIFLENYFENMLSIIKNYGGTKYTEKEYAMTILFGLDNAGKPPVEPVNPGEMTLAEYNLYKSQLKKSFEAIKTKYGITQSQLDTFIGNNTIYTPNNKKLKKNCP